eukprot:CAMPEP_0180649754 /NCGR_PEP_ID=MMETSP1037_2-20121125/51788_1 /TAXON_ID=632150 /ORGANISM="Azadinium spinosum, Strain 3D9" /LENGTH=46 /DNA_ID= /DNA_START= /DNA_END= /DNA_ORIENTATION=
MTSSSGPQGPSEYVHWIALSFWFSASPLTDLKKALSEEPAKAMCES